MVLSGDGSRYLLQSFGQEASLLGGVDRGQRGVEPGADPLGLVPRGAMVKELVLGLLEAHPLRGAGA